MRLMLAFALLVPSAAYAALEPRPLSPEVRLSDDEKEKVLEAAAAGKRERAPTSSDAAGRPIHGEVGISVGTGGYRSSYGTAFVPVGEDSLAIITIGSTDNGSKRRLIGPEWR